jgi:hypothetical protein
LEGKKQMRTFYKTITDYKLIYLGIAIQLLFYISVAWTGWLDIFFSGAALHVGAKGIDFYQIPKGAWAFWHGGSLTGAPLPNGSQYARQDFANLNVYHPLFTIALGSFLMLFNPAISPYIWLGIKFVLSILLIVYFFWSFRNSKHIQFAIFVLLANFSEYLELAAWQFHFVLNVFLFLFLITLVKKQPTIWGGAAYWLGMLVKPIGLLFLPTLLLKRRWKVALMGILLFGFTTWILHDVGEYYITNLMTNILQPDNAGPNQIITLAAFLRYSTQWPDFVYKAIQYAALFIVIMLSAFQRLHISKAIFLMVAYYLCFYNMVFEYQWSSLAYVIAICVVCCPTFQTRLSRFCILLTCLPSCFIVLNYFHIDVQDDKLWGAIPGTYAWELMVISKVIPLLLLCISIFLSDVKPLYKELKAFLIALYKVNDHLEVFGEKEKEFN